MWSQGHTLTYPAHEKTWNRAFLSKFASLSPPKYHSRRFSACERAMASGAASSRGAPQPATDVSSEKGIFNFTELDKQEEEATRNNAILIRRVLNYTYRSAARSWDSRSSSGGSWMLFPAAGEHAASADGSSGSLTLCVSSSSSTRNYWSSEVCEGERSECDAPATLGAQGSGRSTTSTPKGTKERSHPCERSVTKEVKLRQHLRRELEQSLVEPTAVTFRGTIGTVELTESELLSLIHI